MVSCLINVELSSGGSLQKQRNAIKSLAKPITFQDLAPSRGFYEKVKLV